MTNFRSVAPSVPWVGHVCNFAAGGGKPRHCCQNAERPVRALERVRPRAAQHGLTRHCPPHLLATSQDRRPGEGATSMGKRGPKLAYFSDGSPALPTRDNAVLTQDISQSLCSSCTQSRSPRCAWRDRHLATTASPAPDSVAPYLSQRYEPWLSQLKSLKVADIKC